MVDRIAAAGSNRGYYRLLGADGSSVIGVVGTNPEENRAFTYLSAHFRHHKLPVPEVLAVDSDGLRYLQEDLGDASLYDIIKPGREAGGRYTSGERMLLSRVMEALPRIQVEGARGLDWGNCYPQPEFDMDSVLFDLNYFKYCFLKPSEMDFHELKLEADFRTLAKQLTALPPQHFMYRDFQARNVMVRGGESFFIDFQGGRKGPLCYDVASFVWQSSARYSFKLRRDLVAAYYNSLRQYVEVPPVREFAARLTQFVLFRQLQVLGAYGFRGYFERKPHFIASIPPAMQNVRDLIALGKDTLPYPYLIDTLERLAALPAFSVADKPKERTDGYKTAPATPYEQHPQDGPATFSKYDGKGPLKVTVTSFSYHKGLPADDSGNGGGYVFDCRSTHNPGRYEPYKKLTGLDGPVVRFLEDDGEILSFLDSVYSLVDHHVERYIQRGFTHLMVSFGCTGGQHRSVYSAHSTAAHIREKYKVEVEEIHCEQGIRCSYPAE